MKLPNRKIADCLYYLAHIDISNLHQILMNDILLNEKLSRIAEYIFEHNQINYLSPVDIKYFIFKFMTTYIKRYPHCQTLNLILNDSNYLDGNTFNFQISIDSHVFISPKDFRKKWVKSYLMKSLENGITNLEKVFSTKFYTFNLSIEIINNKLLRLKDRELFINEFLKIELDDVKNPQKLIFTGSFIGSHSKSLSNLNYNLFLITSILEFSESIRIRDELRRNKLSSQSVHMGLGGSISIEFNLPKDNQIETAYLPQTWKEFFSDFTSNHHLRIDTKTFLLFNNESKYNKLRLAIEFFNSEVSRSEGHDFLKYWQAIEIIFESPSEKIEYELKDKASEIIHGNELKEFSRLRQIRHAVVHRGLNNIQGSDMFKMRNLATNIFIKALSK